MDLKQIRAYLVLCQVARRNGISVKQVIREIEDMSWEAYQTAKQEGRQAVLAAWQEIPCKGEIPTALELVAHLADRMTE